jgi:hypothetical protein
MIHIDRNRVPAPEVLTNQNGKGKQERQNNVALMGQNPPAVDSLVFTVYKEDEVRQALNQLFHGKCAYCESTYAATAPVDVEHYRPKGRIVAGRKKKKPGYYWLAAEWANLLPSCIDCNRARRQEIPFASPPKQTVGKGDQFPIADESKRANAPGDEVMKRLCAYCSIPVWISRKSTWNSSTIPSVKPCWLVHGLLPVERRISWQKSQSAYTLYSAKDWWMPVRI